MNHSNLHTTYLLADLRTSVLNNAQPTQNAKAIALLEASIETQGLHRLATAQGYHLQMRDHWKGLFALMNPLPHNNKPLLLHLQPHNFESQAQYLHAKRLLAYGVHDFKTYHLHAKGAVVYRQKKGQLFGWTALHYLLVELPLRLREAPILQYAGQRNVDGITYDLVLATWESVAPNKRYDQYLAYFNPTTHLLERANYTIRGYRELMPAPPALYGSIRYDDFYTQSDGIRFAQKASIYINDIGRPNGWAHQVSIDSLWLDQQPPIDWSPAAGAALTP